MSNDLAMLIAGAVVVGIALWWVTCATWAAGFAADRAGVTLAPATLRERTVFAFGAFAHPRRPLWPTSGAIPAVWWWTATTALFVPTMAAVVGVWVWVLRRRRGWRQRNREAERLTSPLWATKKDVARMERHDGEARWPVGAAFGTSIGAPRYSSAMVIAPTRAGKTVKLVVPAVLEWPGSLVVMSTKRDVLDLTRAHRETIGPVYVFDPSGATRAGNVAWSPLCEAAGSFAHCKKIAQVFVESVGVENDESKAKFWNDHGAKVIACTLRAATLAGCSLQDVARWLHTQNATTVAEILEAEGETMPLYEWQGVFAMPPETRGGVFATAQTLFSAFCDPQVIESCDARPGDRDVLSPADLVASGKPFTLYVVCPDSTARRVRPVFEALLGVMVEEGFNAYTAQGRPLDPPMGVILEEAGNIAAPVNLDVIASSYAGAGMPLMSVWQDSGQIDARYGRRARTVKANHTTQVLLRGNLDEDELARWSKLIGKHVSEQVRHQGGSGPVSVSVEGQEVEVATADFLRQLSADSAVVISGAEKPVLATMTPWFRSSRHRGRVPAETARMFDEVYGSGKEAVGHGR